MITFIEPKQIEIDGKTFVISKYPAIQGREIITQYIPSGLPKVGDYPRNEELMIKSLYYAAVVTPTGQIQFSNRDLINNHVGSWETLMKLEAAMMEYNCSFFQNGRASTFLSGIAQNIKESGIKMLTDSLAQLWEKSKQPSKN